ncbi:pyridoxal phosphate-dependent transferase [Lasiosphaeria miniovina]|uniref:Pyridoxal phosphate-dependent transferase n=1 Tax=Lasiosphaeria miniovina TaxID=1954250 RepID=A0AA39ZQ47_9PEZI|nr:pyridoxal phosphate-dependent transferase [Lasiosphaeria miniovina]KAK0701635.1 pyridoxal phosphate-dependent transferase [Lasiosphaeria miniovina]
MENNDERNDKKLINLIRGWPSPHLLPAELLRAAANKALADPAVYVPGLQYGPDPGYQPLREELAAWLGCAYKSSYRPQSQNPLPGGSTVVGVGAGADQICITGGASQSIACILQSFTDPAYTRAVWAVAPCYFLACPIFEDAGFRGRLRAVPEDDEGIDLEWLGRGIRRCEAERGSEEKARFPYKDPGPHRKFYRHVIYAVPTSANPSGKTMSLRRREGLVRLAREHDALVICDDVYDFLQWPVLAASPSPSSVPHALPLPLPLLPRLSDIDLALGGPTRHDPAHKHFGHAISNGSFSKLIGPGVRTGWTHSTADFALGVSQTGSTRSGGAPSQIAAAVVHQLLASGDLDAHLDHAVRPALQQRHARAAAAVKAELGWAGVEVLERSSSGSDDGAMFGGYFLWLTLPEDGPRADEVVMRAQAEENLVVAPGSSFEVSGDEVGQVRFPRNLRICYSWEEEDDIVEGIRRLGMVLRRLRDGTELPASELAGKWKPVGTAGGFK